ncbi:MAG: BACON domain-containing carbohydrate-binding protein [Calditrichota bacterium]
MRRLSLVFALFILAQLVLSCKDENNDGISSYIPLLSVTPQVRWLPNDNDSAAFTIKAEGAWSVSDTVSWITVRPDTGRGDGVIMVYVTGHSGPARSGSIAINAPGHRPESVIVRIEQDAEPPLRIRPDSLGVAYDDTTAILLVQAQGPWTVHEDIIWVSADPLSGDGDGSIALRFERNSGSDRRASLFVTAPGHIPPDFEVVIVQMDVPDPLEVIPMEREVAWGGAIVPFTIRAAGSWSTHTADNWLTILQPGSGTGTDYIRVSVDENPAGYRQGSVVITAPGHRPESITVFVNQSASPQSVPAPPTHLMVAKVYWDMSDITWYDQSNNETNFQVERRLEQGEWLLRGEPAANSLTFSDSTVEANKLYSYRVRAANNYGASEPSNEISFLTHSAPLLLLPSDLPLYSELSPHGDIDWFKMPITSGGEFTVETTLQGLMNSQMWLYGPNDREIEIAYDNDDGDGYASKITETLTIGDYFIKVAGVPDSTMGNYHIAARPGQ